MRRKKFLAERIEAGWFLPLLLVSLIFVPSVFAQYDPKLVEAAKKEGKVSYYSSASREASEALGKAFTKKYGIPVEVYRATSNKVVSKVIEEMEAKNLHCDVFMTGSPNALLMEMEGRLQKLDSQEAKAYPKTAQSDYYAFVSGIAMFIMYNTEYVKKAEAPKNWKDELNPKWKGKIAFADWRDSTSPCITLYMLKKVYGQKFIEDIAKQQLIIYSAHGGAADAVASGEAWIALEMLVDRIAVQMKKGAPIDYNVPDPAVFNPRQVAIPNGVPHPNAAKLFVEFALSKEGQKAFNLDFIQYSYRPDIDYPANMVPPKKINLFEFTREMWVDFGKTLDAQQNEADKIFGTKKKE